MMILESELDAQPTDGKIAETVAIVERLTTAELDCFARQLALANAVQTDLLIDALIDAFEIQPTRQQVKRMASVVEAERRQMALKTFADVLRQRINGCIDGMLDSCEQTDHRPSISTGPAD